MMSRREINIKRVEFSVPLTQGFGVTHVEVSKAVQGAVNEYCQLTGTPQNTVLPDDAIRVDQGDGELVVFFELRRES